MSPTTSSSSAAAWAARADRVLMPTYGRFPVAFARGEGARLWDTTGREYVDLAAGIAVCALGHAHPGIARALSDQAGKLLHVSNLYQIPEQIELAEALAGLLGYDRFFFCNSGAEANEAALKLARAWGRSNGGRHRIVVCEHGFHGRTLGALSATAQPHHQEAFTPLLPGIDTVPFGEPEALRAAVGPDTAAVLLEPVQAEGGGIFADAAYLEGVRAACDEAGCLLIFDEVQTGMGRTGTPLASTGLGVQGDAVTLAKGLGGGVPIGALAVREDLAEVLGPGSHASTFGGNPLVCRAALVVAQTLAEPGFLDRVRERGEAARGRLAEWGRLGVDNVRGRGLFCFFQVPDAKQAMLAALAEGVLVVAAKGNAIRLAPPLTLTAGELDAGLNRLEAALGRCEEAGWTT